jgi:hypothetical protein
MLASSSLAWAFCPKEDSMYTRKSNDAVVGAVVAALLVVCSAGAGLVAVYWETVLNVLRAIGFAI